MNLAPSESSPVSESSPALRDAIVYLIAIAAAEVFTNFVEPHLGLVLYGTVLIVQLWYASKIWDRPLHKLLIGLACVPILRLVSFSLPVSNLPTIYWYLLISEPLLIVIIMVRMLLKLSWKDIGIARFSWQLQFAIGTSGIGIGFIEYQLFHPNALVKTFDLAQVWLPVLILVICTGLIEELIFRGIIQHTAILVMGRYGAIYSAILYALLQMGNGSWSVLFFTLGVALFWGWTVQTTRSLLGASLAHGLANVMLFVILPVLPEYGGIFLLIGAAALGIILILWWMYLPANTS